MVFSFVVGCIRLNMLCQAVNINLLFKQIHTKYLIKCLIISVQNRVRVPI